MMTSSQSRFFVLIVRLFTAKKITFSPILGARTVRFCIVFASSHSSAFLFTRKHPLFAGIALSRYLQTSPLFSLHSGWIRMFRHSNSRKERGEGGELWCLLPFLNCSPIPLLPIHSIALLVYTPGVGLELWFFEEQSSIFSRREIDRSFLVPASSLHLEIDE